jgi:hypothetical protein
MYQLYNKKSCSRGVEEEYLLCGDSGCRQDTKNNIQRKEEYYQILISSVAVTGTVVVLLRNRSAVYFLFYSTKPLIDKYTTKMP